MAKFIILSGSIKQGRVFGEGEEIDLSPEEAARINKKGPILEATSVRDARVKASDTQKATVAEAERKAAEELELAQLEADEKATKSKKGGGK